MDKTVPLASTAHKRTSSAAENAIEAPEVKRRTGESSASILEAISNPFSMKIVYIVMVESRPQYTDATNDISGVYATVTDANNHARAMISDEFDHAEGCSGGIDAAECIWWEAEDAGEGEWLKVSVQKWEVKGPGSEPEREKLSVETSEGGSRRESGGSEETEEDE